MTERPSDKETAAHGRLRELAEDLSALREELRKGGGEKRIQRQHDQGKLTARVRFGLLLDAGSTWVVLGLLVALVR
jgi:acetyl-CoA carboxylase carboxyltransferase component